MSINAVPNLDSAGSAQFAEASIQKRPPAPQETTSASPIAGSSLNSEAGAAQSSSSSTELPEDEVQVQRDSQTNGEVVIKYLDHAGNLILQVPSSQMIGLARAIEEDFQQEAKARSTPAPDNSGGGTHGR
jgi:hypothetical protein